MLNKNMKQNTPAVFTIGCINWKDFPYKPDVLVTLSQNGNSLLLHFNVKEKCIRAEVSNINGPVHEDSCVECFISPFRNGNYYNFEFNCIGTAHAAYGPERKKRERIPLGIVKKIRTEPSLGKTPFPLKEGDFSWDLKVEIPKECFIHDPISSFNGLPVRANFYKCGDKTSDPHFLSWQPVNTENPDFHQYRFLYNLTL